MKISKAKKLTEIGKKLSTYLINDRKNWVETYKLMAQVRDQELFSPKYPSFTSWVNNLAELNHYHVSTLWQRFKAGNVYSEYVERQKKQGKKVEVIENIDVSPDSIALIGTIAGRTKDKKYVNTLMNKTLNHDLSRSDLRKVNRKIKRDRRKHKGDSSSVNQQEEIHNDVDNGTSLAKIVVTADDMVKAFKSNSSWLDKDHRHRINDFYAVFPELPLKSGTSKHARRMDECILENLTDKHAEENHVNIHAIENKVAKDDLINDEKMQEYSNYGNYMWLCVPKELVGIAKNYIAKDWGILQVDDDQEITIIKHAKYHDCLFADQDLTEALIHLYRQKHY